MYACRCLSNTSACLTKTYSVLRKYCLDLAELNDTTFCATLPLFHNIGQNSMTLDQLNHRALEAGFDDVNPLSVQAIFSPLAMDYYMSSAVRVLILQM